MGFRIPDVGFTSWDTKLRVQDWPRLLVLRVCVWFRALPDEGRMMSRRMVLMQTRS